MYSINQYESQSEIHTIIKFRFENAFANSTHESFFS